MKKIILAGLSLMIVFQSFAFRDSSTDENLQLAFRTNFPNAEKVQWFKEQGFYIVNFVDNGILTRISYNENGKFNKSVRNYTAETLPYYLVNQLKTRYPGQDIYGITEIASATDIEYFVKLRGSKYWTTVALTSDGASYVVERYRKAK